MHHLHRLLSASLFALLSLQAAVLLADEGSRPDAHAPISVMGEHSHSKGEFMLSYRYMSMTMEDMRSGSDRLNTSDILVGGVNTGTYMVAPVEMTMDMHMLGMMYAPSNTLTWMFMLPYLELSMDSVISPMHGMHPNEMFTTESNGIGDFKATALFTLEKTAQHSALLGLGISLPTGSINEEDEVLSMPALGKTQLPFPMQLGSGTYDLLPSLTYNRVLGKRSWGAQVASVVRVGRNDNGYTLGNRFETQTWHAWLVNRDLSASLRLGFEHWDNINGDDLEREIPASMIMGGMIVDTVPSLDSRNQGGQRFEAGMGVNGIYGEGEHRVALEVALPLYQSLEGPQMERDLIATFGYQKAF